MSASAQSSARADATRTGAAAYFPGIDGLRAVAVLAVIGYHLRPEWLEGGFAGVDVFFVISGFVVTSSLAGRRFSGLGELLAYFYARRIVRIVPALLATLLVTALFATLVMRLDAFQASTSTALAAFFGVSNLALAFSETSYFAPAAEFDPFLHTWTLGVEEQFYLLFPFYFYLFRRGFWDPAENRRAIRAGVVICGLSFVACGVAAAVNPRLAFYLMPMRLWEFGAGVVLRMAMPRWRPVVAGWASGTAAIATASGAGGLAVTFAIAPASYFPFPVALVPVACTLGLIALVCARPAAPVIRRLSHPGATFVGRLSYSLYLWHWPVFALFRWTVGIDGAFRAGAALLVSAAAAMASYSLLEEPVRRAPRVRSVRRRTIIAFGAASTVLCALVSRQIFASQASLATRTAQATYWDGADPDGRCVLATASAAIGGGALTRWTPKCPGGKLRGTLWVIGDSHANAYTKLITRYAAETGTPVTLMWKGGCPVPSLRRPATVHRKCAAYQRAALDEFARKVRPGDVLFLPGSRIAHTSDNWTGLLPAEAFTAEERAIMYREAVATLATLSASGVKIIIEAPLPVFPSPAFRCSDWFNRPNPDCRGGLQTSRSEMDARRAPVLARMRRLTSTFENLSVWDPFPVVCPGSVCSAVRDGFPLFTDGNHMSGRGNDLLYPSFAQAIDSARES